MKLKFAIISYFFICHNMVCQSLRPNIFKESVWKVINIENNIDLSSTDTLVLIDIMNCTDSLRYWPTLTFYKDLLTINSYRITKKVRNQKANSTKGTFLIDEYNFKIDSINKIIEININENEIKSLYKYCFISPTNLILVRLNAKSK